MAVIVVVAFIVLGQVLARCGGSEFFTDLAMALMGRYRGGAVKVSVAGSALFGMVSGSAVANVSAVGVVTIPLMRRAGCVVGFYMTRVAPRQRVVFLAAGLALLFPAVTFAGGLAANLAGLALAAALLVRGYRPRPQATSEG